MQDKDASQDDERVRSVNAHINRTGEVAGGLLLITPSVETAEAMRIALSDQQKYVMGEQDFLGAFFESAHGAWAAADILSCKLSTLI